MKTQFFVLFVFFLVAPTVLCAQEFRGTISGMITDTSGAPIPNVSVTAIATQTGAKTQTVTNGDGDYTIPFLAPGHEQRNFLRVSLRTLEKWEQDRGKPNPQAVALLLLPRSKGDLWEPR